METSAKEKEYIRVKNSLEALGFHGFLGADSVSLVKNVLDNLIKATKAFKTIKLENERLENEMSIQGNLVLPLRNENHKLLQDNNDLHKEIIDIKDKLEIKNTTTNQNLQKSIENMEQMKFLVSQKNIKIKNLEFQIESLKKKLNDVFEDIYMYNKEENGAERGLPGSRKYLNFGTGYLPELCPLIKNEYSISGGMQGNVQNENSNNINANEILEALRNETKQFNLGKEDIAKDFQQNNNEINKLRENINILENTLKEKENEIEQFQRRLILRDDEVKRLQNNAFLGDENLEEIKVRYNVDYYREQNEQLKRQNDFLNKENHRLNSIDHFHTHKCREEEVIKLRGEIEKLKLENNRLKQRTMYTTTNTKRKKSSNENSKISIMIDKEESEKKEIAKYQKIIRDLTGDNETSKGKLILANKKINEMKNQYQLLQNENDFLKKKIINLEKDNNELKNKINNVNANENKEIIEQIKDLKNKNNILINENKNLADALKIKDSEIINNLNLHQKETDEINKEIALIKNQNNELQIAKKSLEDEMSYLRKQLNNNMSNNNLSSTIQGINLENNDYQEIINGLKQSQTMLENDIKIKDKTIKQLNEEKEKKDSDYKILEIKNKNLNEQLLKLQNEVLINTKEDNLKEQLKESNNELKNTIEQKNKDIFDLEKTNKELKSIITGIQNASNGKDININNEEQTNKLNETINSLRKDNNKLIKNLELFKQENHLAAEKIKQLESLINSTSN